MITAAQAHKTAKENRTMCIVARELEFVYNWIEGKAKLGNFKCNWISPDEFSRSEIKYIVDNVRHRGFEVEKSGKDIYTFLW